MEEFIMASINTNMASINAQSNLNSTQKAVQNSLAKLSSGFRITKAADDAAGLAISEKMRGQISGLKQASSNAQSAISLIQTGEGALSETTSILQRMRELAVQSGSDTNTASDRKEVQKEVNQLSRELSRIGNTTEFNTQSLLNGNFKGTFQIGANQDQNISLSVGDMRGNALKMTGTASSSSTVASTSTLADGTYTVVSTGAAASNLVDSTGTVVASSVDNKTFTDKAGAGASVFLDAVVGSTVTMASSKATADVGLAQGAGAVTMEAGVYSLDSTGKILTNDAGVTVANTADGKTFTDAKTGGTIATFGAAIASGTDFEVAGINVSTQADANKSVTTINNAIASVSSERSKLGAMQNRLEHTITNLGTSADNMTAAESNIRDVDMAAEMSKFTKNQVLAQAGVSMLAQANQAPQTLLKLLG